MRPRLLTTAAWLVVSACSSGSATNTATPLTPAHAAALRDSVQAFLTAYAADVSAPPIGKNAREALGRFLSRDVVMTTDLGPGDPVMVQTLDSLVPPNELVSQPSWIRSTRFEWGTMVITPLAPGVASYSARYAEHVTDSTGTQTDFPGTQQGIVRHEADGWRILAVQSSHPIGTHQAQAALTTRMTRTP
ncbi:MAG: hypothetical protein JNL26_18200 [Gemmatimonadetes bacterium]|nr:hypothetical protein [Gemmatimonadota bacterium]